MKKPTNWHKCACGSKENLWSYTRMDGKTPVSEMVCDGCAKKRGLTKPPLVERMLDERDDVRN